MVFGTDVKWCVGCSNITPHNIMDDMWSCAVCNTVNGHKPAEQI